MITFITKDTKAPPAIVTKMAGRFWGIEQAVN
jgi:hypothetical protein